jgi:DNA-binding LytR/AlgR family response regulator
MIDCLIVDDEPFARNIIRAYCSHLPVLNIVAECGNAIEAREILQSRPIALLFLDIHMPVLSGTGFLSTLKNPPAVIFTTAYQEYAVTAFDLAACDYLLKPFSLERFMIAVDKAKEKLQQKIVHTVSDNNLPALNDGLFIKAGGKLSRVLFQDFLYAEAQGNYTKIVTFSTSILTKQSFSAFIASLPAALFIQVHRSFIINKTLVSHIEGNRVFISGKEVPLAPAYRDNLFKDLGLFDDKARRPPR